MTTGRELAAFWTRCEPGTRLTCVSNTYWEVTTAEDPSLVSRSPVGRTFNVVQNRATHLVLEDGGEWMQRLTKPARVGDVLRLAGDQITFRLDRDGAARLAGHTATWRIENS